MNSIIMVDDGTGNGIQIPSVMISKTIGESILTELLKLHEDKIPVKTIVSFEISKPDDRVEYDIWFTSSNDRGLDFIRDFQEYHEKLGKKVLMTPRYFSWSCTQGDSSITDVDGFCDGKYCSIDENNLSMNGRDILHENLRQKCVYKNSLKDSGSDKLWWDYIKHAHSLGGTDFSEDCSKSIHAKLKIDFEITSKGVNDSFSDADHSKGDNTILNNDAEMWGRHGTHYIPAVVINQMAYRGVLDPENVYSAIGNGFKDLQDECKSYVDQIENEATSNNVTFNWFIVIIIILIFFNIALLLICKRINQRSMKSEVSDAVNDYMKLRQGNELSDKV